MAAKCLTGKLTFQSLRPLDLSRCTKREIQDYFENSYDLNDSIFMGLKDETAFFKYPDKLRLPLIFYYGHTACVYVNKLKLTGIIKEPVNLKLETMLETGVDEMTWDDTENYRMGGSYQWPSLDEVVEYRKTVRKLIIKIITDMPLALPVTMESPWWALMMGMEHERIHIETSSVLIRQLPIHCVQCPTGWKYAPNRCGSGMSENTLVKVEETSVTLGKPYDFPSYGWDNEYGKVDCVVSAFEASQYLVTNKEFLEFVHDSGYKRRELWTREGWDWLMYRKAEHPTFWVCTKGCVSGCGGDLKTYSHCKATGATNGQEYRYRAIFDEIDMPWEWPVDVNYHEAHAFCQWKGDGFRLLAEAEHHVIRGQQAPPSEGTKCDIIYQDELEVNLSLQFGSSTPVNMYPPTDCGFYDVFGNVWEWAEDHFNGLPGYRSHWLYDDFSSPCFDGRHTLIMGGSWVSTGDEASRFARFAFRRHFFQHAGFRLARSIKQSESVKVPVRLVSDQVYLQGLGFIENPTCLPENLEPEIVQSTNVQLKYDSEKHLHNMLQVEYSADSQLTSTISKLCQEMIDKYSVSKGRALHLGAGTGHITFELARIFNEVLGLDFSGRFIDTCNRIQEGKEVTFPSSTGSQVTASLPQGVDATKIVFKQLTWLSNEVETFDFILVNFLSRVLNSRAWLARFKDIINKKKMLVVCLHDNWEVDMNVASVLGEKFRLKETKEVKYRLKEQEKVCKVTVWKMRYFERYA